MLDHQIKFVRLRLPVSIKLSNIYWGWWDLINTSVLVAALAALLIYSSLYLMGVAPIFFNVDLPFLTKNPELGLGLLGFTASAGSAAGLWILSNGIVRWSVINRVIYINNEFLAEFGALSLTNTQEWPATLKAYAWAITLLNEKLLSLNSPAQKHLYGSLICSHILIDTLGPEDIEFTEEGFASYQRRLRILYIKICLANLYLNCNPRYAEHMLTEGVESLRKEVTTNESIRQLFEDLNLFILPSAIRIHQAH